MYNRKNIFFTLIMYKLMRFLIALFASDVCNSFIVISNYNNLIITICTSVSLRDAKQLSSGIRKNSYSESLVQTSRSFQRLAFNMNF